MAASQPVADKRVTGAQNEERRSSGNEHKIEHGALLFESVNIVTSA
jgi:hypothetical protein